MRQVPAAKVPSPAVATQHLMNQVCRQTNLAYACQRVRANGGAPGIDGMSVDALPAWLGGLRPHGLVELVRHAGTEELFRLLFESLQRRHDCGTKERRLSNRA